MLDRRPKNSADVFTGITIPDLNCMVGSLVGEDAVQTCTP